MLHRFSLFLAGAGIVAAGLVWSSDMAPSSAGAAPQSQAEARQLSEFVEVLSVTPAATCDVPGFEQAAAANAASLHSMRHAPFGRAEKGWETYAPRLSVTLRTDCDPQSAGFAAALADWETAHGHVSDGVLNPSDFDAMKTAWQGARPYVALRASGVCPDAPSEAGLTRLSADEGYGQKTILLRNDVATAYRAMVSAAREEVPEIAADPEAMDVFSGFRSPAYDDARCARDGNCGGVTRAKCSAHRTGYTFDLVVGSAPGHPVDSTNDQNRLHMTRTPAYLWLVANADRFGFVNYVFEPWHWEYVGSGGTPGAVQASIR